MGGKTGSFHACVVCGKPRWRTPSDVRRNIRQTCSKECLSIRMSGAGNPFWGKVHSPEVKQHLSARRRARSPSVKSGPAKGGFRHTPEARAKIKAALKERWRLNRDKMMAAVAKAALTQKMSQTEEPRHRKSFTPMQRREWGTGKCVWCESTENLNLDHIIPVMAGGSNQRTNAQTLCKPCNLWKMVYVDRAITFALLGSKSGLD